MIRASKHPLGLLSLAANSLLIAGLLLTLYGAAWEYSTRSYLKGFSDAIVPFSTSPEQKAEAILTWMARGPARQTEESDDELEARDPEDTLNYRELLHACGTATNAFVNLASTSGLQARRLLLLGPDGTANHVVAEVWVDGRWIIVDPSFHAVLRDGRGRTLTRAELADPGVLREATRDLPGYDSSYNYSKTTHLRLARVPIAGRFLRVLLDFVAPQWEEKFNWSLLVERQSCSVMVAGVPLFLLGLSFSAALKWYGASRLSALPIGAWEQLQQISGALFSSSSIDAHAEPR